MTCCTKELENKIRVVLNESHPGYKIGDSCVSKLIELLKEQCPYYSKEDKKFFSKA